MTTISASVERYHRPIIVSLLSLIALVLVACVFNDLLPVCHYLFGCDHGFHSAG
jgi:hypothetical protein